jgi:uncharacterized protein (TIGR04222 family)
MTLAFLAALLTINVALRALPVRRHGDGALTATECAFLRGGTRAAVLTVLATQHVRGDPAPDDSPNNSADDSPVDSPDDSPVDQPVDKALDEAFDHAVSEVGDPPGGIWGIARSAPVRRASARLRDRLVGDGLLPPTGHWFIARCVLLAVPAVAALAVPSQALDLATVLGSLIALVLATLLWLAPRRTVAGWRALRAERRRYEQVTLAQQGASTEVGAVGMLVALYGQPALDLVTQQPPSTPQPSDVASADSPLTPRRLTL